MRGPENTQATSGQHRVPCPAPMRGLVNGGSLSRLRKAERAREKAAQAQAVRAEADAKVAEEQAAALARALHEDESRRQADLREVAEKEAEAVPEWPLDPWPETSAT